MARPTRIALDGEYEKAAKAWRGQRKGLFETRGYGRGRHALQFGSLGMQFDWSLAMPTERKDGENEIVAKAWRGSSIGHWRCRQRGMIVSNYETVATAWRGRNEGQPERLVSLLSN